MRAQVLLNEVMPDVGGSIRVAVSGPPGVGKSTFIDALGMLLLEQGLRVAVLAVDPSSTVSGGSILGDKTRMARLARDSRAYIRPSPSAATLGGVARRTRETMLLCEAAGFDVVIVETVGVGQSETVVADMVDTFLVLMLPRSGDELQGIKKGILEVADLVAVNKADGEHLPEAREAMVELAGALRYSRARDEGWQPRSVMVSALTGDGVAEIWDLVLAHRECLGEDGLARKRRDQRLRWMWGLIEERLLRDVRENPRVGDILERIQRQVTAGEISPSIAADLILAAHRGEPNPAV